MHERKSLQVWLMREEQQKQKENHYLISLQRVADSPLSIQTHESTENKAE